MESISEDEQSSSNLSKSYIWQKKHCFSSLLHFGIWILVWNDLFKWFNIIFISSFSSPFLFIIFWPFFDLLILLGVSLFLDLEESFLFISLLSISFLFDEFLPFFNLISLSWILLLLYLKISFLFFS